MCRQIKQLKDRYFYFTQTYHENTNIYKIQKTLIGGRGGGSVRTSEGMK